MEAGGARRARWSLVLVGGIGAVLAVAALGVTQPQPADANVSSSTPAPTPTPSPTPSAGWSIDPATGADGTLYGVSCAGADDCWAVGGNDSGTLLEQYTGPAGGWQASGASGGSGELNGVSCVEGGGCLAVGGPNENGQAEAAWWDGGGWTETDPDPDLIPSAPAYSQLDAVTCISASDCWAAGFWVDSGRNQHALIEEYDGTGWTADPLADPTPVAGEDLYDVELNGVSCLGAGDCWAVGSYEECVAATSTMEDDLLTARWNGTAWSQVASPDPSGSVVAQLAAVSCAGGDCWATGYYTDGGGTRHALAEMWGAGTAWSAPAAADPTGNAFAQLNGVSCLSASYCAADGLWTDSGGDQYTLIDQLNGTGWTATTSLPMPDPGADLNPELWGMTCASAAECWAVGQYNTDPVLIEEGLFPDLALTTSGTPASAAPGSSYNLDLMSSLGSGGSSAESDPVLTVTLPAGETFAADPGSPGWSCSLDAGRTVLTCTSTAGTPISAGASLGTVTGTVDIAASTAGGLQMTATLADTADAAATVSAQASVTVSSATPTATPVPVPATGVPPATPASQLAIILTGVGLLLAGMLILAAAAWRRPARSHRKGH